MEPASLTIGAVGFAFQAYEAIQAACELFTAAANMQEDMAALRLRLLFEYSRIVDWAQAVGLSDQREHARYEVRVKHNKAILYAVLCELRAEIQALTHIRVRYIQDTPAAAAQPGASDKSRTETRKQPSKSTHEALPKSRDEVLNIAVVGASDLQPFADLLSSVDGGPVSLNRKHAKGVDKVIKFFKSSKAIASQPRRLWWASHDKESFEGHLKRVQELTQYLHEAVEAGILERLMEDTRSTCLAVVQLEKGNKAVREDVREALAIMRKQHDALQESVTLRASVSVRYSRATIDYEELFRFKMHRQDVLRREGAANLPETQVSFGSLDIPPVQEGVERTTGTLSKESIFVEWKGYHVEDDSDTETEPRISQSLNPDTVRRVKQLVAMLQSNVKPEVFRTPECIGYVQDDATHSVGLVYRRPQAEGMCTLREMFLEKRPSLTERTRAAVEISSSLSYLHAVGWLHKNLCSSNILFMGDSVKQQTPILEGLKLSGFSFARPDHVEDTSTSPGQDSESALYRHPLARSGTHFRKTFDIYSLGLLLVELAYWQPITSVILNTGDQAPRQDQPSVRQGAQDGDDEEAEKDALPNLRDLILNTSAILDGVADRMGERYRDAAESCIRGREAFEIGDHDDEADAVVGTVLQLAFRRRVVDAMGAIVV